MQGLDFRLPLLTSPPLQKVVKLIRQRIAFYSKDRYLAPDIEAAKELIKTRQFHAFLLT